MEIKTLLTELDGLLQKGKFVEAAEKFFSDSVETINEHNHPINGKDAKIASIKDLQNNLKKVHSVKLINQTQAGDTTFSEFNYHYEYHNGAQQSYGEIIKRVWDKNGKIVSEKYYTGAIDPEKKPAKKVAEKKEEAPKKAAAKPVAEKKVVAEKKPAAPKKAAPAKKK